MKIALVQGTVALSLALSTVACGPKLESVTGGKKDQAGSPHNAQRETVTIGISVEESNSLALAAATSFSMSLEGCASGLTYTALTEATPNVDVYKYDQNCLIKLNSFRINGIIYVPSQADSFTSWIAGDSAIFEESGNSSNSLQVVVSSQLGNPISGTEAVGYSFSQIVAGAGSTLAKSAVGASHALSVSGQDATPMTIAALSFIGMTAQGAGQFQFTLDCDQNVTGTAPALSCAGTSLDALKYRLVKDDFGGTLTATSAAALFNGNEPAIADSEKLAVGAGGAVHGGFVTRSGASALAGPNVMHSNPNMLLVIQVAGTSYRYFNIDVSTLTYP